MFPALSTIYQELIIVEHGDALCHVYSVSLHLHECNIHFWNA